MGYYNVVRPCVVGRLHYASVPSQPIEVDDEVAAPLVELGDLTRYSPGDVTRVEAFIADLPVIEPDLDEATSFTEVIEPGAFKAAARKRAPRKAAED